MAEQMMQQQGMAPEQAPRPEEGEAATPEEQAIYDEFVTRAKTLIFDPESEEVRPQVVKMLNEGDDPKQALGQTAATIFFRVEQQAAKDGVEIPQTVKEGAGEEVFSDLAQVASANFSAETSFPFVRSST